MCVTVTVSLSVPDAYLWFCVSRSCVSLLLYHYQYLMLTFGAVSLATKLVCAIITVSVLMLTCGAVSVASVYHYQYLMLTYGSVSVASVCHYQYLMLTCGAVFLATLFSTLRGWPGGFQALTKGYVIRMHTLFIVILVDCAYIYIYMDCVKDEKGPLSLYNVSQMNIGTVSKPQRQR